MGYLRRTKFFEMPKNLWFFEHDTSSRNQNKNIIDVGYMKCPKCGSENVDVTQEIITCIDCGEESSTKEATE